MVVQELDGEQGDALRRFRWRVRRRRADANGKGPEDEERSKAPRREQDATRREHSFAPGKARIAAGVGRDTTRRSSVRTIHRFILFRRPFSHIAEASGCRACTVGWAIAV